MLQTKKASVSTFIVNIYPVREMPNFLLPITGTKQVCTSLPIISIIYRKVNLFSSAKWIKKSKNHILIFTL